MMASVARSGAGIVEHCGLALIDKLLISTLLFETGNLVLVLFRFQVSSSAERL